MRYRRSGSATGSDRSITAWMSVKIAVVPPMPSDSVSTAAAVKTGDKRNCRIAYRTAPTAVSMSSLDGYRSRRVDWNGKWLGGRHVRRYECCTPDVVEELMDPRLIWLIVGAAVLVAIIALLMLRRQRSQRLRQRFGPEYERTVRETGDVR